MKTLLRIVAIFFLSYTSSPLEAQVLWQGTGDGTSWHDAANWSTGVVPTETDLVEILMSDTITGDMTVAPIRVKVGGGSIVNFHLSMTLGNVAGGDHAFVVGANSIINFGEEGTPYTFNFNTKGSKSGINNNSSGDSSLIVVMKDATLNFNQHNNAMNLSSPHTTFENNGVINISSSTKNGIKSKVQFFNNGEINIEGTNLDGIQIEGGIFSNEINGFISIVKCADDGLEVKDEGVFSNSGELTIFVSDDASSSENGIAVGTEDTLGVFINTASGIVHADGGTNEGSRVVSIYEEGDFSNEGQMSIQGGNSGTMVYSKNKLTNEINGYINLNDGRINVKQGSLTNNGLIETMRSGSGVFTNENTEIINNAFFQYDSSGVFAIGNGNIVDNGINLSQTYRVKIDAQGTCMIDIADVGYDWFIDDELYGSSDQEGAFSFEANSLNADSVLMTTTLPNVRIKVINICLQAVMITASNNIFGQDAVKIYPSSAEVGSKIKLENVTGEDLHVKIFGLYGTVVKEFVCRNTLTDIDTNNFHAGQYFVNVYNSNKSVTLPITLF